MFSKNIGFEFGSGFSEFDLMQVFVPTRHEYTTLSVKSTYVTSGGVARTTQIVPHTLYSRRGHGTSSTYTYANYVDYKFHVAATIQMNNRKKKNQTCRFPNSSIVHTCKESNSNLRDLPTSCENFRKIFDEIPQNLPIFLIFAIFLPLSENSKI